MALLIENFRDFTLQDDENNPRLGEIDMSGTKVKGTILAHGVVHFNSGVIGKKRFDSAGVHGDEVDGQYAVNNTINALIRGEIDLSSGEWLVAMGNILAIRNNVREVGFNLNRLFGRNGKNKAAGAYERTRADELDRLEDKFKPQSHSDWHGTIAPVHAPFVVSSIPADQLSSKGYRDYRARFASHFGISNTIIRPYTQSDKYATFEWSAADRMIAAGLSPQAETVELGQIGTKLSSDMSARITQGLKGILANDLQIPESKDKDFEHKTWRIDQQVIKSSPYFKFQLDEVKDFMPLGEGQLIAKDGDINYIAKKGQVLVFPHESVKVGEQVFLLISQEKND